MVQIIRIFVKMPFRAITITNLKSVRRSKVSTDSFDDRPQETCRLLPESRKTEGLIVDFAIRDNISINNLKKYLGPGPFINHRVEYETTEEMMKRVGVKAPDPMTIVGQLSGGNQQKVVIARWLNHHCKVLIFDEPTRGIDVGAKAEIYMLMRRLTNEGYAIIFISSELPEIVGLCDRVAVFRQGAIVATLAGDEINSNEVMRYATTGN